MRVVIQRVSEASVAIGNETVATCNQGLVLLLGIETEDTQEDIAWLCRKIVHMRIFGDKDDAMNLSLKDVDGEVIIVSQFTLHASTKKGNRPSFIQSAKPDISRPLYFSFILEFEKVFEKKVGAGEFGADMKVKLINDGPVTILLDSKDKR